MWTVLRAPLLTQTNGALKIIILLSFAKDLKEKDKNKGVNNTNDKNK